VRLGWDKEVTHLGGTEERRNENRLAIAAIPRGVDVPKTGVDERSAC
jgi:hypothetical protein